MQQAPIPADEAKRLALLAACKIIYTPAEQAFDDVARLAAELCGTEIALITLVDSDYQWFKARVGVELTGTARDLSFCGHCINGHHPLIVEDTLRDPRFADNPLVTGDPQIRFYAGVPLEIEPGSAVGALSVADRSPRALTERQLESLRRLAKQIARELRLRRDLEKAGAATPLPDTLIVPGTMVGGRWRIGRELGRGAVGVVYEAHDPRRRARGREVPAPRVARARGGARPLRARGARADAPRHAARRTPPRRRQPGRRASAASPTWCSSTCRGRISATSSATSAACPPAQAFRWCADACDGAAQAHEVGVVHRDIKPSNVFLADTGGREAVVKVVDFGLAAGDPSPENSARLTGEYVIGSPAYMAPEQMIAVEQRRRAHRHLVDGRRPLRAHLRAAAVRREHAARDVRRRHDPATDAARRALRQAICPIPSTPSLAGACRRIASGATRRCARWPRCSAPIAPAGA